MRVPHAPSDTQLTLRDVTRRYGDRVVLDRVDLTVRPGEKIGVLGDNGSGKSTLLRLMAGRLAPDDGTVTVSAPGGIGYLGQTLGLPASATVAAAIDVALADIRDLERRLHAAERDLGDGAAAHLAEYAALVEAFEARGGYDADARVERALHGLGRPGLDRDRPLGTLSGGDQARLALAGTLASAPELLLLDEPTNDLDDAALHWLEERLRAHRGSLVAVTHDRTFLERITSTVLEVDGDAHAVHRHGDGYRGFLAARATRRAEQQYRHTEWRAQVARHTALLEANSDRLTAIPRKGPRGFSGAGAFRARSRTHGAAGRIRAAKQQIGALLGDPVPAPPEPLRFAARVPGGAAPVEGPVVELTGVAVPGRLRATSLRIAAGGRLLVTGPNGAGKSTLLRVLAGELAPASGSVRRPARVGHLRQHDDPATGDPDRTLLEVYAAGLPGPPAEHAAELLALGLFRPADLDQPVRALSVGQRRRADLARLVRHPVDLLLLDEPTNHLAPDLVEDLERALADYPGAVVTVTHDRRIRSMFTGATLHLSPPDAG
ncbi:ABC-F family ATP-binding cassette domain-containing protein [Longispora urticae]